MSKMKTAVIACAVTFGGLMSLQAIGKSVTPGEAQTAVRQRASESAKARASTTPSRVGVRGGDEQLVEAPSTSQMKKAEDTVSLIINLSGNLCAKPIEVKQVDSDHFGVRCIKFRNGRGRANYLINARTNDVSSI